MSNMSDLDLENEFQKTANAINAKLQEAANALKEANRLAREAKLPALIVTQWNEDQFLDAFDKSSDEEEEDEELDEDSEEEDYDEEEYDDPSERIRDMMEKIDVSPLEAELEDAGWSTSSSYC